MTIRIGILGAGRIGKAHAAAISATAGAQLVCIAEPFAAAAQAMAEQYGCAIRTIDEISASADVDGVIICTPTDTHADLIEQFCRAGKAVFCEKPVDLSLQRVKECLQVVEETNGTLMVGFNRRFDPDFIGVKTAIDDGAIGKVEMVSITSRDPGAPPLDYIKRSGGIFRDMTIHDFDVARWLLGEEVTTVQAAASVLVDDEIGKAGDYDSANILLTTASGRQAVISNSRRATYGYDQRIEVLGSKGLVSAENHHENRVTIANAEGFQRRPLLNFFMERYMPAYEAEIRAFVAAVEDGGSPPTTGHDGLMAMALADAALKSVEEGRLVKLSEILV
ncbi:inositol 2-dehydrogenase [Reinekea sp.]|jgi:myo-inositol 2-dehydrogenase/D-chiro-inositol 1-dehydrogenase|uniref:inositol 2-dehydrogenase n=1 Tax=Reinekea sp. TaxID=1970455 RepID=UPI002A7FB82B|nr:inositol 2-dehydrogenase [Reinekea sp.]